jgi:hypothetical protein
VRNPGYALVADIGRGLLISEDGNLIWRIPTNPAG